MGTFDEKTKTFKGDVEPDKPRVWDTLRGVWKTGDEPEIVKPEAPKKKKVAKKKKK